MNIKIIKSRRKTFVIQIKNTGEILVKAPEVLSNDEISKLINAKMRWITKKIAQIDKNNDILDKSVKFFKGKVIEINENYLKMLFNSSSYLIERTEYLAKKFNFEYNDVKIKKYKSRWGACTKNKTIYLNVLLMALKPELIDSVIIHELCHTKFFNHKQDFYKLYNNLVNNPKLIKTELNKMSYITKLNYT